MERKVNSNRTKLTRNINCQTLGDIAQNSRDISNNILLLGVLIPSILYPSGENWP